MGDTAELDDLLRAARHRVAHVIAIVALVLAAISSQISLESPVPPRTVVTVVVWSFGCLIILGLGMVWYRSRAAATERLAADVRAGACRIRQIEKTKLRLELVPVGVEVDVELASGEHLAFGYWTESEADRLIALLAPLCGSAGAGDADPVAEPPSP